MNRVAITGIGMIDALGNNRKDCFSSYMSTENSPVLFNEQNIFPVTATKILPDVDPKLLRILSPRLKNALHAANQAIEEANINSKSVAVIAGNPSAKDEEIINSVQSVVKKGRLTKAKQYFMSNEFYLSSLISNQWKFEGLSTTLNSACTTSLFCNDYAMRLVDEYDFVICICSDNTGFDFSIYSYASIGALGTVSDPFGDRRDGYIPGEGAACFVLESEQKATKRNANIKAWLHPAAFANDGFSISAPNPDGTAEIKCMTTAAKDKNILFVNAHGTSTPIGDEVELKSIKKLFNDIEIIAPKKKIGHTAGTSGNLEIIYGIELAKFRNQKGFFLKNSFGFAGKCASQLVEVE